MTTEKISLDMEIYNTIFRKELKRLGINARGMIFHEFRNTLSFEDLKLYHKAKVYAETRTKEIQQTYLNITCADQKTTMHKDWINLAVNGNKALSDSIN